MATETEQKIEFEEVTIKLPKNIVNLLKNCIPNWVEDYVKYSLIQAVRADIDAGSFYDMHQLARIYNLNPIFERLINDPVRDC